MKSIIIFAGAGASRGVSLEKYPMALDFRRRLTREVQSSQLYSQLVKQLGQSGLSDNVDIEHVLWELSSLSDLLGQWTDPHRFAAYLLSSNQIGSIVQAGISGPSVSGWFSQVRVVAQQLQDQINSQVYDYYSRPPNDVELEQSWVPLLQALIKARLDRIDIVTTNYDLVIEHALHLVPEAGVEMGFNKGLYPGIDLSYWRNDEFDSGLLTKLHGSVDWKIGNGGSETDPVIRRGHPEFDGDHKKRLILYPGFKGIPAREPFIAFHEYFRRRLQQVTHAVFIGFAFRDEFINQLITDELPRAAKVMAVNPSAELPKLPFLKRALHLKQGFGIPTASKSSDSPGIEPFDVYRLMEWLR